MKRLTLKQSTSVLIICISTVVLIVLAVVIIPSMSKIKTLETDIRQIQQELDGRYERTKRLRRSLRELSEIKVQVQKFKDAKIERGSELAIITQLEKLADKHTINQTLNVSFSSNAYTFSFLNHGSFSDQIAYLKALEQLPYYVEIKQISWNKQNNSGEKITTRFDAKIYVKE